MLISYYSLPKKTTTVECGRVCKNFSAHLVWSQKRSINNHGSINIVITPLSHFYLLPWPGTNIKKSSFKALHLLFLLKCSKVFNLLSLIVSMFNVEGHLGQFGIKHPLNLVYGHFFGTYRKGMRLIKMEMLMQDAQNNKRKSHLWKLCSRNPTREFSDSIYTITILQNNNGENI